MSIESNVRCDFCGAVRGATNHWWTVRVDGQQRFQMWPYGAYPSDHGAKDACGEKCVSTAISRCLNHGDLNEVIQ